MKYVLKQPRCRCPRANLLERTAADAHYRSSSMMADGYQLMSFHEYINRNIHNRPRPPNTQQKQLAGSSVLTPGRGALEPPRSFPGILSKFDMLPAVTAHAKQGCAGRRSLRRVSRSIGKYLGRFIAI